MKGWIRCAAKMLDGLSAGAVVPDGLGSGATFATAYYGGHSRGLDAGLAKALPVDFDGKSGSYRDYRRRLELFKKLCVRRGPECEAEGTLTLLQCLPKPCWDATRHVSIEDIEKPGGFDIKFECWARCTSTTTRWRHRSGAWSTSRSSRESTTRR